MDVSVKQHDIYGPFCSYKYVRGGVSRLAWLRYFVHQSFVHFNRIDILREEEKIGKQLQ